MSSQTILHNFPLLYQINARKQIYVWRIYLENRDNSIFIITEHGVQNGNMVSHEKQITKGKGKKTIQEQAIFDANSMWRDKIQKSGYVEFTQNNSSSPDSTPTLSNNPIFYPMLANTFSWDLLTKKKSKIEFPLFVQRKYDGIRCNSFFIDNTILLKSRKAKEFNNLYDIRTQLSNFYTFLHQRFPDLTNQILFDGELFTSLIPFEKISGVVRLKKIQYSNDLYNESCIQYHIYDCYITNHPEWTFQQRWNFLFENYSNYLLSLSKNARDTFKCILVDTFMIQTKEQIKEYHDQFVQDGFEGIMLRNLYGIYDVKKRSNSLLKYKEFLEEEFEIIGFHEGEGDDIGTVIWECKIDDSRICSVKPRGTREIRRDYFLNGPNYIGKKLTIIYQEMTADGIPRFPVGKEIRDYED
jgi:ATP-dependent DNA ligase